MSFIFLRVTRGICSKLLISVLLIGMRCACCIIKCFPFHCRGQCLKIHAFLLQTYIQGVPEHVANIITSILVGNSRIVKFGKPTTNK